MRALALALALAWPAALPAQELTPLPELRARIDGLYDELDRLRGALAPAGQGRGASFSGSPLLRLSAIESELRRLTAKTEELEYHVDRIVRDGTARIGDLDYRLCMLEPGCSPRKLSAPQPLGGAEAAPVGPVPLAGPAQSGGRALFDGAKAALEAGEFEAAAQGFADHLAAFPGGPLTAEAELLRGRARERMADAPGAARAYLAAFSADRDGAFAAEALTELGRVMGDLGQTNEACVTLAEVGLRFSASPFAHDAQAARRQLNCP